MKVLEEGKSEGRGKGEKEGEENREGVRGMMRKGKKGRETLLEVVEEGKE